MIMGQAGRKACPVGKETEKMPKKSPGGSSPWETGEEDKEEKA